MKQQGLLHMRHFLRAALFLIGVFLIHGPLLGQSELRVVDPLHAISDDPNQTPKASESEFLRLVAPRNGVASAQAVVISSGPMSGMRASVSALRSEDGTIFDSRNITLRYASRATSFARNGRPEDLESTFDVLLPAMISPERVQPIWLTVEVPKDATPGEYIGRLSAQPGGSVEVKLTVLPWVAPDPQEFRTHLGMINSPDSIAMHYGVPMWSSPHLRLLKPSLEMLGKLGNDTLYLPLINRTHFGNEETIVRWGKRGNQYLPDFRALDAYLRLYKENAGQPSMIILYLWENAFAKEPPAQLSVSGLQGSRTIPIDVPFYGQPGSEEMWKAAIDGIKDRVKRAGMNPETIMLGVVGDGRPNGEMVKFFETVAPDMKWAVFTHGRGDPRPRNGVLDLSGLKVGYQILPYRSDMRGFNSGNPYGLGWKQDFLQTTSLRSFSADHPAMMHAGPTWSIATTRYRGLSRVGLDFWHIDGGSIIGKYHRWHNLYRDNARWIVVPGPTGALPTARYELFRMGMQEAEAAIVVEQVMTDNQRAGQLSPETRAEAQKVIAGRMSAIVSHEKNWPDYANSGWIERSQILYRLAGEFSEKFDLSESATSE